MTIQQIKTATKKYVNDKRNSSSDFNAMFETKVDENLNATFFGAIDIDEVIDAIDYEGYPEDEYGDYPTLTSDELYDILTQIF